MGHDIHFLSRLQEVDSAHVDTAMRLYKDPPLLREVLSELSLPDGAERVALSLSDPVTGPFVVVERGGHFVTCLRPGMTASNLLIVPRGRLDAVIARIESLRTRWQAATEMTGGKDVGRKLISRLKTAGQTLSREEFVAISAIQPLIQAEIYTCLVQTLHAVKLVQQRARRPAVARHIAEKGFDEYWQQRWLLGHLTLLFTMDCQDFLKSAPLSGQQLLSRFVFGLLSQQMMGLSLIATWAAARLHKQIFAELKQAHVQQPVLALYTGGAFLAIAARHSNYRGEIGKLLARRLEAEPPLQERLESLSKVQRSVLQQVILDNDKLGLFRLLACFEYQAMTTHVSTESGLRYERPYDIPLELLPPTMAITQRPIRDAATEYSFLVSAAALSRCEASDLYLPEAVVRKLSAPITPEVAQKMLAEDVAKLPVKAPVRAESRPGRNDPCPCESGKKYKRCCG